MTVELINLLQWLLASACLTAGLILSARRRLRALAALLILFSVHMLFNALEETRLLPGAILVTPAFGLVYGPLFYIFVRRLIFAGGHGWRRVYPHFIPALIALPLAQWFDFIHLAALASLITYGALTVRLIGRYHAETASTRSDAASIRLNWITQVFAGFAALTVIDAVRMFTRSLQSPLAETLSYAGVLTAGGVLMGALVWRAITQPDYFKGLAGNEPACPAETTPDPADAPLFLTIDEKIRADALHRQPHLTLSDVASVANLTERDVSRAINAGAGRSFCDYINAFRVSDVCAMLNARPDATILDIAFEAGFTSKSSFNAVFKKESGVTPSEYRRRNTRNH
ncbi:helix-turn-helix domain-containing protein [Marinicaulis aureus]|uniref:Helix-turn-helix domain-containing protein n=1 Tax=Hyphococcus aureus TaxID=2666033 RepID=A0ABW1KT19_9PROT